MQHAALAAIQGELAATDGIDGHPGRVGRIFDGKFHIHFHRHIAKKFALYPDETNLIVALPGNIIARPDVDIIVRETLTQDRLDRFGLGGLLRRE